MNDIRSRADSQIVDKIDEMLNKNDEKEITDYYTNMMRKRNTYGGHLEILVFCDMMKVNVKVHTIQNGKLFGRYVNDKVNKSYQTLNLFHHNPVPHYWHYLKSKINL